MRRAVLAILLATACGQGIGGPQWSGQWKTTQPVITGSTGFHVVLEPTTMGLMVGQFGTGVTGQGSALCNGCLGTEFTVDGTLDALTFHFPGAFGGPQTFKVAQPDYNHLTLVGLTTTIDMVREP